MSKNSYKVYNNYTTTDNSYSYSWGTYTASLSTLGYAEDYQHKYPAKAKITASFLPEIPLGDLYDFTTIQKIYPDIAEDLLVLVMEMNKKYPFCTIKQYTQKLARQSETNSLIVYFYIFNKNGSYVNCTWVKINECKDSYNLDLENLFSRLNMYKNNPAHHGF